MCGEINYIFTEEKYFDFETSTGTVIGYNGIENNVVIPDIINGVSVKSIGDRVFFGNNELTRVVIPFGVESIGNSSFEGCARLINAELPLSLKKLGSNVFSSCSNLTTIELPNGVTRLENGAFYFCNKLKSIKLSPNLTYISEFAFTCCEELAELIIPESVQGIGKQAFEGCKALKTLILPKSLKEIGSYAFTDCSSITNLEVPYTLITVEENAFSICENLDTIIINYGENSILNLTIDDWRDFLIVSPCLKGISEKQINGIMGKYVKNNSSIKSLNTYDINPEISDNGLMKELDSMTYRIEMIGQPNKDKSSIFRKGSTIRINFKLFDNQDNPITIVTSSVRIYCGKVSNCLTGTVLENYYTVEETLDDICIYSTVDNQYYYNLGTKDLDTRSTYNIVILVNDKCLPENFSFSIL